MARDFTIGIGNEPQKTILDSSDSGVTPVFDELVLTYPIDLNSSLMPVVANVYYNVYYEQVVGRFIPMNIKGTKVPYIIECTKE
jgi:hypothetical protein